MLVIDWQCMGGDAINKSLRTQRLVVCCQVYIAWRKVRSMFLKELEKSPKLGMMEEIVAREFESSCAV